MERHDHAIGTVEHLKQFKVINSSSIRLEVPLAIPILVKNHDGETRFLDVFRKFFRNNTMVGSPLLIICG